MPTVLHIAPHPDDESLGAPCALLTLLDAGYRVVVAVAGLGRPDQHKRRLAEVAAAVDAGGFELVLHNPPVPLSSADDLQAAERRVEYWLAELLDEYDAELVVGPHEYDGHPAHEAVGRAISAAAPRVWWSWGIWADVRNPNLLVDCSSDRLDRARAMLACHAGELARNDYMAMFDAARRLGAIRGMERILGFGAERRPDFTYSEILEERRFIDGIWRLSSPRLLTPAAPLSPTASLATLSRTQRPEPPSSPRWSGRRH